MSVVVLQLFRRNSIAWLWLAVACHAAFDGVSVFLQQLLPFGAITNAVVLEEIIAVMGAFPLWLAFALRERQETPIAQNLVRESVQTDRCSMALLSATVATRQVGAQTRAVTRPL